MIEVNNKTVIAAEGKFEEHPEAYRPRIFIVTGDIGIYELLQDGQAVIWPHLPQKPYAFDHWVIDVENLNGVNMRRKA